MKKNKFSTWFAIGFTLGGLLAFLDKKNREVAKNFFTNLVSKIRKE